MLPPVVANHLPCGSTTALSLISDTKLTYLVAMVDGVTDLQSETMLDDSVAVTRLVDSQLQ